MQHEDSYIAVRDALKGVQKVDLDRLIVRLAAQPSKESQIAVGVAESGSSVKTAFERMGQLLELQKVIGNLPRIAIAVQRCESRLLHVVGEVSSSFFSTLRIQFDMS